MLAFSSPGSEPICNPPLWVLVKGKEDKRVRISDIADELGLSTATVSNVIHGKTKKVSEETIKKVQEVLEEKQYIPSMAGILLAQNSSRIIGVVINDHEKYESKTLEDDFIASSLNSLSTEIEKFGKFMMVKKTTKSEEIIKFASMWNLEGLVLIGFCDADYVYLRNHMHIPFVIYDGFCEEALGIYNITIDNFDGGRQVGELFKEKRCKKVLCISDNDVCMDKERYDGFCRGFGTEGADLMLVPMQKIQREDFYQENLEKIRSYSAIFAVSDFYAVELIHFLKSNHISVPNEIMVAGFDDTPICIQVSPSLTSVKQDVEKRAQIALEKLEELKEKRETERIVRLPVTLICRESTEGQQYGI